MASAMATIIIMVLGTTAVGAIGLGRMTAVRSDLQRSADGSALAAVELIRKNGLPLTAEMQQAAESTGQVSTKTPVGFDWRVTSTADYVEVEVVTRTELELTEMVWNGGRELSRRTVARLPQSVISQTERRKPKLVLALDYSGSMTLPFTGATGQRAIDILEISVAGLLNADLDIDYASVFYNSGVFDHVGFGGSAINQILNRFDNYDAGGGTNYSSPLGRARSILAAEEDTGRYVLMVSDGQPGDSPGQIASAASSLWAIDATIFSLEIRRHGSSPALAQNLIAISGTPADRGDPSYHFVATSGTELVDQFSNILAEIACRAGPVTPAPADPSDLSLLLFKPGMTDIALVPVADVFSSPGVYGYSYDAGTQMVALTDRTCSAVLDSGYKILSRSQPGVLVE
jgi:Mg-chelatase subunit ChlD